MATLRTTTPPLFFHLVSEVSKKGVFDNQFLVDSLLQVEKVSSAATVISTIMSNETNETGKKDLFVLLARVLAHASENNQEADDDGFTDDLIISLCSTIATFPIVLKDSETYELLHKALTFLINKLSETGLRNFQTNIAITKSPYVSFVFSVFSEVKQIIRLNAILGIQNIPTYEGLKIFFNSNEYSQLEDTDKTSLTRYNPSQLIKDLLTSFTDASKAYGEGILLSYFHFWPEEAKNISPNVDSLLGFAKKELLRKDAVRLLEKIEIENKVKVIQTLCSQISSHDEFARLVVVFASTIENIDDLVEGLLKNDSSVFGGCLIAQHRKLFETRNELINVAFPNPVKRMKIAIELAKTIENPCEQLFEAMLNQSFVAYANGETSGLANFVELSKSHSECFANFLLKRLVEVTDKKVLNVFANHILDAKLSTTPASDKDLYYKLVCHLYSSCDSLTTALRILSIYRSIELPELDTALGFLDACVDTNERQAFLNIAEGCINQYPLAAVLCIAIPSLDDEKVSAFIKAAQRDESYTYELGVSFFTVLAKNYFEAFLSFLEKEQIGKQVTNNIFVNRKKRIRIGETVRAVLTVLPIAYAGKESLSQEEQQRLYSIIHSVIPRVNDNDYIKEIHGLKPIFRLLKDATPTEEQYNAFIDCGFMEEFPVLFAHVEGNEELAQRLIVFYVIALQKADFSDENIEDVAKTLFNLDPTEVTLFFALELAKKQLTRKENCLKFVVLVQKFAEAARAKDVKVESTKFAGFLLRFMQYLTFALPKFRSASFAAFEAMFSLEQTCDDIEDSLTQEQISERAVNLLTKVQNAMSTELVNAVLQIIIVKKAYFNASGYFIRTLFESRENFASADYSKNILKLFVAQPSMPSICQFHLDRGVMALANRQLIEFIAIFLLSESVYQTQIVQMILLDPSIRDLFIDTTFVYLTKSNNISRSLNLFYILKRIILTEPSVVSLKTLGMLFTSILLWLGALYDQQPNLNLIQSFNISGEIEDVVDIITSRTCLARKVHVSLSVQDIPRFVASTRAYAAALSTLPASILETVFEYINKVIESPNPSYVLSVGLFTVAIAQCYTYQSSLTENLIHKVIPESLVHAFEKCSHDHVCCLAYIASLKDDSFRLLSDEQCVTVYKHVVEGLVDSNMFKEDSAVLLASLLDRISSNKENILAAQLLEALRNVLSVPDSEFVAKMRPEFLKLLLASLEVSSTFEDFTDEKRGININRLFSLVGRFQVESLTALRKVSGTEDIISGLVGKIELPQLGEIGLNLLKITTVTNCDADLINLLSAIGKSLASYEPPVVVAEETKAEEEQPKEEEEPKAEEEPKPENEEQNENENKGEEKKVEEKVLPKKKYDVNAPVLYRKALLTRAILVGEDQQSSVKELAAEIVKSMVI